MAMSALFGAAVLSAVSSQVPHKGLGQLTQKLSIAKKVASARGRSLQGVPPECEGIIPPAEVAEGGTISIPTHKSICNNAGCKAVVGQGMAADESTGFTIDQWCALVFDCDGIIDLASFASDDVTDEQAAAMITGACANDKCLAAFQAMPLCDASCALTQNALCPLVTACGGSDSFATLSNSIESGTCGGVTISQQCYDLAITTSATIELSAKDKATLEGCIEDKKDNPCFARSSTACRLVDTAAAPGAAYAACFDAADRTIAERVPMAELRAGDYVLSEVGKASRVVFNQHVGTEATSAMVQIDYGKGSLALTPDHVLKVDGAFVAAREVLAAGSMLGEHKVERVTRGVEGVINPITVAGTILAAGKEGMPVVASTYPEWIAAYMLSSSMPLPISLSNLLAFAFPANTQAFYDALVEPLFPAAGGSYRSYLEAVPTSLKPAACLAADLGVSGAFALFSLGPVAAIATFMAFVALRRTKA